jgi:two-component system sensor kinase FixL
MFGYDTNELLGQSVNMLMPVPDRSEHDSYLDRYARTGVPHIIGVGREVEAMRKDGSRFPAFLSVGQVAGSNPPRFVGFVRDVTTERQALATIQAERDRAVARRHEEQEARRLQERMTHVSRMATMGEMAAGIAHELNQPLSAIATYARACERFLKSPAPDLPETLSSLAEISLEAMRRGDHPTLRQLVSAPEASMRSTLNELVEDLGVLMHADARIHQTSSISDLRRACRSATAPSCSSSCSPWCSNAIEALEESATARRDHRPDSPPAGRAHRAERRRQWPGVA